MITGINESKTLIKDISWEYKCRLDEKKSNLDEWWNNDKCRSECKKRHLCEKDYVGNPTTCSCENTRYSASIMYNSAIMCNEVIESYKVFN